MGTKSDDVGEYTEVTNCQYVHVCQLSTHASDNVAIYDNKCIMCEKYIMKLYITNKRYDM